MNFTLWTNTHFMELRIRNKFRAFGRYSVARDYSHLARYLLALGVA